MFDTYTNHPVYTISSKIPSNESEYYLYWISADPKRFTTNNGAWMVIKTSTVLNKSKPQDKIK